MHSNLAPTVGDRFLANAQSQVAPIWSDVTPTHLNWLTEPELERFWSDVEKLPNGCWHYNGSSGGRSGLFSYRAGNMAAHRVAYRLVTGRELGTTEFLKPMCEDQRCIAPEHNSVVPRRLLQTPANQHTRQSLEAHPAYQGVMSAQEVVRFLSQPGAASWTTKTGRLYVWWNDHQYEGETLEEAVRAAKEAA